MEFNRRGAPAALDGYLAHGEFVDPVTPPHPHGAVVNIGPDEGRQPLHEQGVEGLEILHLQAPSYGSYAGQWARNKSSTTSMWLSLIHHCFVSSFHLRLPEGTSRCMAFTSRGGAGCGRRKKTPPFLQSPHAGFPFAIPRLYSYAAP